LIKSGFVLGWLSLRPNNSFKPKTNRCAIVFGLIQALEPRGALMAADRKGDGARLIGSLVCIGLIGGIYSLVKGESLIDGFFGSLRAFGIAAAIIAAHAATGALIGYLFGKGRGQGKEWATGGALVGFFLFLVAGQAWL